MPGEHPLPIDEYWLIDGVGRSVARIPRRDLAVDVGANRGDWTVELAKTFTRVVAFEPDPRASSEIPVLPNAEVRGEAVCSLDGSTAFHLRPDPLQNSLLENHPIGGHSQCDAPVASTVVVPCTTLDSSFPDGADFVKIDVEGAEGAVLGGCLAGVWSRTVFVVECHDTRADVVEHLWRLGKRVSLFRHVSPEAHPGHCWLIGEPS